MIWTSLRSTHGTFQNLSGIRAYICSFHNINVRLKFRRPFVRPLLINYTRTRIFMGRLRTIFSRVYPGTDSSLRPYLTTQPRRLTRDHATSSFIVHLFNDIRVKNTYSRYSFNSPFSRVTLPNASHPQKAPRINRNYWVLHYTITSLNYLSLYAFLLENQSRIFSYKTNIYKCRKKTETGIVLWLLLLIYIQLCSYEWELFYID